MKKLFLILILLAICANVFGAGSIFPNGTYYGTGGNVLNIRQTNDVEVSFWMKQNGDPGALSAIYGKGTAPNALGSYYVVIQTSGRMDFEIRHTSGTAYFGYDVTAELDNTWHHFYLFLDRSNLATCEVWVDGTSQTIVSSGVMPTEDFNSANFIAVGAGYNGTSIATCYIASLMVKIGGTKSSTAQIQYQAANPFDYSSSAWTLDGTYEAWDLDDGSGTTGVAAITTPADDFTMTNASIWSAETPVALGSSGQVIMIGVGD